MKPNVKKNDLIELYIEDLLPDGNGVGKKDGFVIFVPRTCIGDRIVARIIKVGVSRAYAKIESIIEPSKSRIEIDCPVFKSCGGCVYRHLDYEVEKEIKKNIVEQNFKRIGGFDLKCEGIKSPIINRYRGKAEYPCALINGKVKFGFYARGSHRLIPCCDCLLQPQFYASIVSIVEDWCNDYSIEPYNEETKSGLLRHLYIRSGKVTGDIMVCLVVTNKMVPNIDKLIEKLCDYSKDVKSIVIDINNQDINKILSNNYNVVYGKDYIEDVLCGLKFKINPLSFFQVNHDCAKLLYNTAKEYSTLNSDDILLDLYCGTGTIGLSMANNVKSIVGVEIIDKAIENAIENAKNNNIHNSTFICSDAGKAATKLSNDGLNPNIIVLDPPRSGCDKETIDSIIKMKPERIVMISCNSSTAARDTKLICDSNLYSLSKYCAVDMFPRTGHVETVVLMNRV